jgi:hypothetical protein
VIKLALKNSTDLGKTTEQDLPLKANSNTEPDNEPEKPRLQLTSRCRYPYALP